MSAQVVPKGGRLAIFACRKTKSNSLASTPRWVQSPTSGCRWNSSFSSAGKRRLDGRAPGRGWTTFRVLGLAAVTSIAGYYVAMRDAESKRLKEKSYSNRSKFGGEPIYASITEMEAVSKASRGTLSHTIC